MKTIKTTWAAYGSTALFVLLWGSGAISSRWALDHSSAFAILTLRFALALVALLAIAALRRQFLPQPDSRRQVLVSGLALIGGYSICYFLALENGVTPGVLATVLGVQPILTLVLVERHFSAARLSGLLLALGGLALVVQQGLSGAGFSALGMLFALLALGCVTFGAILQKRIGQAPQQVLPLQYMASLLLCLLFVPFRPFEVDWVAGFVLPWLWLGLVISVGAQLLLYRLIQAGNLVNVTGLFYLVPVVTALLDHLLLGNALPLPGWIGMAIIFAGLGLAFRQR
ncbi:DMT family transporter [Stutzerimonas balearica]|uniref:EamA-like transporter family protein n=1 Tax=Stutzerimonas balearica DSM 6083 TaxID=1123016 RepID=A0A8D3Y1E1_9GAMM|nr:DMT family transporter [Stutzerimonas balearica]AJE15555.1 multidrug DMT transporter permease [Stutzerimonas balearica DSM 6083]SDM47809.1 EamA-like transporter family protein [Stutzerimonas balearica DSM 6083]